MKSQVGKEIEANLCTFIGLAAYANESWETGKFDVFFQLTALRIAYQFDRLLIEFLLRISASHWNPSQLNALVRQLIYSLDHFWRSHETQTAFGQTSQERGTQPLCPIQVVLGTAQELVALRRPRIHCKIPRSLLSRSRFGHSNGRLWTRKSHNSIKTWAGHDKYTYD